MKIAFLGDISFNDEYINLYKQNINPFENIQNKLTKCDYVIGNLECISEGDEGENLLKKPRLKTKTETLSYLNSLNISAVTLAHNHIFDNLKDGFLKTTFFLESNQIKYLGAGLSKNEAQTPILIEKNNEKLCFLSYVHQDTNPNLPNDCPIHLNIYEKEKLKEEINHYKQQGYFVTLLLHWGGKFEGGKFPDRYQPKHAKEFIRSGADLIVGHHSHTLQAYEKISGKYVFYSLGNFCFADIVFEGKIRNMSKARFRESLIPIINIKDKHNYSVELVPIVNDNLRISTNKSVLRGLKWRNFLQILIKNAPVLWFLYKFHFKVIDPVWHQITRKDAEKSFMQRIFSLNLNKVRSLLKV